MSQLSKRVKLVLGHMPFIGVSYQDRNTDLEYGRRFSDASKTREVIEAALALDVRRFAAATPRSNALSQNHLKALKQVINDRGDIRLLPCIGIPIKLDDQSIEPFRRWKTYITLENKLNGEAGQRILSDPILNLREGWRRRLSACKPYVKRDFQRLQVDWKQTDNDLEFFEDWPVAYIEFGSEADFLAMADRLDLLGELVDRAKAHGFGNVLFGVHHAGVTIPKVDSGLEGFRGYVTPLNLLGVLMLPTKPLAEMAVQNTEKAVFTIKPLAGGRVNPKEGFTYVSQFSVEGCMFGAASVDEVKEDVEAASNALKKSQTE